MKFDWGFSWNLIEYFLKICQENSSFIKTSQEQRILYKTTNTHFWPHVPQFCPETNRTKVLVNIKTHILSYVYWTVHHLDSWVKRDQLDVTCFIISLFYAQHVSDVNTSIHPQELATYLLSYSMGCIALVPCVLVLRCGLAVVVWYAYAGWGTSFGC